ncbi:MAG: fibronectin type III domain-containing protein [Desulfobacteraceae bacterium]|nr:fibronectin type III domain-containing protein [Desulfobacteraceae bacterium]MBC2756092.1 fibronectin type III domain-containing protein [Desulfobacteraceae bacterium]MBC2763751.1 fibronectin type III domain-containing protein [ANME-2 cluster archaeon]
MINCAPSCLKSNKIALDSGYYGTSGTPPAKLTNVLASNGDYTDKVVIDWTPNGALIYEVFRADIPAFLGGKLTRIGSSSQRPYEDTTAEADNRNYYWIKAKNSWGASRYSLFNTGYVVASQSPPTAPVNVAATDGLAGKVTITWDESENTIIYEIWRATKTVAKGGKPVRIGTADNTTFSFDDTSLTCGVTYYYWVKARDSWGSSPYSVYNTGYCGMAP